MDNKLTLKLNDDVIERAKIHARKNNASLSKMIEAYLAKITSEDKPQTYISPNVESLIGVIELSEDFDYKNAVAEHLAEKYK